MAKIPNHQGKVTFEFILTQFETCIGDIRAFVSSFPVQQICTPAENERMNILVAERPGIEPLQLILCDIAYSIVFFGLKKWDRQAILELYKPVYNQIFLKFLLDYISRKPHRDSEQYYMWKEFAASYRKDYIELLQDNLITGSDHLNLFLENQNRDYDFTKISADRPFKYYGGHQFKLGHYYRHLFQTVKYINEQKIFSYDEKYEYAKTLRAQLSTPEQYLLFFNSVSRIGRDWELNKLAGKDACADDQLITKYNLIKNIPTVTFLDFLEIQAYYPMVTFEFQPEPPGRKTLEKKYH